MVILLLLAGDFLGVADLDPDVVRPGLAPPDESLEVVEDLDGCSLDLPGLYCCGLMSFALGYF